MVYQALFCGDNFAYYWVFIVAEESVFFFVPLLDKYVSLHRVRVPDRIIAFDKPVNWFIITLFVVYSAPFSLKNHEFM